jgi:hypothetical protein
MDPQALKGPNAILLQLKYLKRVRRLEAADGTKGTGDVLVLLGPLEEANAVADWVMDKVVCLAVLLFRSEGRERQGGR